MANYITKGNLNILRCSNGAMGLLYEYLVEALNKRIEVSSNNIKNFVELLDQDVYGFGAIWVELDEHLPAKEDRIMLKTLVSKVIIRLKEEKSLSDEVAPRIIGGFEEFRDKILD